MLPCSLFHDAGVLACVQGLARAARDAAGGRALDAGCARRRWEGEALARRGRSEGDDFMAFQVEEAAHELIAALRTVVRRIKCADRALADQLTRAASSVALNLAESNYSDPGNRRARLFTAAGSANETRAALRVAVSWGYCAAEQAQPAQALLDRIIAILWKLTH